MTVGALLQLEYGNTDRMAFLTLNPQITHFKSVYKKYTNFATQFLTLLPRKQSSLSWDQDTAFTFTIPRDGDAIRDILLSFELPDIYSDSNYQFQWIKRIGEYIVRSVSLQIDTNQNIDRHYGEWFHAYSELNYSEGKKKGYYKMIGNVPELYDPANAPGNGGIYPTVMNAYAPSIINRTVYLPLLFWFNKYASMSFPLIAIQKQEVNINFIIRPLRELYTVIDYSGSPNNGTGYRVQPSKTTHYIGNFITPINTNQSSISINPRLEINNIFLDNEERKRFALSSHEYLITQLQYIKIGHASPGTPVIFDLKNINKPVTEFIFMIRRTDMENVNDWSNFTNWNYENIPPYSLEYVNQYGNALSINSTNIAFYKTRNLLKSAVIRIQTQEITAGDVVNNDTPSSSRISGKDSVFYNLIQNFNANANMPDEGIYTYSFSLDNTSLQPTGAINMSSINNKDILMNLTQINPNGGYNYPPGTKYDYTIQLFAVNYEIVKIMGGMVGTMTSN